MPDRFSNPEGAEAATLAAAEASENAPAIDDAVEEVSAAVEEIQAAADEEVSAAVEEIQAAKSEQE